MVQSHNIRCDVIGPDALDRLAHVSALAVEVLPLLVANLVPPLLQIGEGSSVVRTHHIRFGKHRHHVVRGLPQSAVGLEPGTLKLGLL